MTLPPRARSSSRQAGQNLCLPYAEEVAGVPAAHVRHQPGPPAPGIQW